MRSRHSKTWMYLSLVLVCELALKGCASGYTYNSTSNTDPTLIFGDKLDSHYMYLRALFVKTGEGCFSPYKNLGRILNYSPLVPSSRTFKVPVNTAVGLSGLLIDSGKYGLSQPNDCSMPAIKFTPEAGHTYIIDISAENLSTSAQQCSIYIQKVLDDGTEEDVYVGVTLDRDCQGPQTLNFK